MTLDIVEEVVKRLGYQPLPPFTEKEQAVMDEVVKEAQEEGES